MSVQKTVFTNHANASGVAGLADASIKGQWEFGTRRGALLIISQPHSSYIPPKVFLKNLVDIPALRNKALVTEVISCPAYSLYLSSASGCFQKHILLLCTMYDATDGFCR